MAIRNVERAESEQAEEIASLVSESGLTFDQPVVQTVKSATGQEVTVAMMTFVAAANTGQESVPVPISVPEGQYAPKVEIPLAVLNQVTGGSNSPIAVVAGVMPINFANALEAVGAGNASDNSTPTTLVAPPLSITIYDANGQPLSGIKLAKPITLTLQDNASLEIACSFFDTAALKWSLEGLRRVVLPEDLAGDKIPLRCETDHLSVFGAVKGFPMEELNAQTVSEVTPVTGGSSLAGLPESVLNQRPIYEELTRDEAAPAKIEPTCNRPPVFVEPGAINAITKGGWVAKGPTLALWACMACGLFAVFTARVWDRLRKQLKWQPLFMNMTFYEDGKPPEGEKEPDDEDKGHWFVIWCCRCLHALQASLDTETLELAELARMTASKYGWRMKQTKSPLYKASAALAQSANIGQGVMRASNLFIAATWSARVLLLFPAVHPVLCAAQGSLITSRASRTMLIFVKILVSGAIAAFLFGLTTALLDETGLNTTTTTLPPGVIVEPCTNTSEVAVLLIGICSAIAGDIVVVAFNQLRKQDFKSAYTRTELRKMLTAFRRRNVAYWLTCIFVLLLSAWIICAYIASAQEPDSSAWAAAAMLILLEEFIFMPFLQAVVLATLATYIFEGDPSSVTKTRSHAGGITNSQEAWGKSDIDDEICPACNSMYTPDSKFCRNCGRPRTNANDEEEEEEDDPANAVQEITADDPNLRQVAWADQSPDGRQVEDVHDPASSDPAAHTPAQVRQEPVISIQQEEPAHPQHPQPAQDVLQLEDADDEEDEDDHHNYQLELPGQISQSSSQQQSMPNLRLPLHSGPPPVPPVPAALSEAESNVHAMAAKVLESQARQQSSLSTSIDMECPQCGNVFMNDAKFCRKCGERRLTEEEKIIRAQQEAIKLKEEQQELMRLQLIAQQEQIKQQAAELERQRAEHLERQRVLDTSPAMPPRRYERQGWQQQNKDSSLPKHLHSDPNHMRQGVLAAPRNASSSTSWGLQRSVKRGANVVRSHQAGPPQWPPPTLRPPPDLASLINSAPPSLPPLPSAQQLSSGSSSHNPVVRHVDGPSTPANAGGRRPQRR